VLPRRRDQQDISDEIRFHLAEEVRLRVERGEAPEAARREARRLFGNEAVSAEDTRQVWLWGPLDRFSRDLTYAVRSLSRTPGFSAIAVLTLALGIGSGTAAFSVVNAVLLRPLPYPDPDELVSVDHYSLADIGITGGMLPLAVVHDLREQIRTLSNLAAADVLNRATLVQGGPPEVIEFSLVAGPYFEVLGVRPVLGRLLPEGEFLADGTKPALLSYGFWNERFGGSTDALGQTFRLEGQPPMTIVGVLPKTFLSPDFAGVPNPVWTTAPREDPSQRRIGNYASVGRIAPGATIGLVRDEAGAIGAGLAETYPDTDGRWGVGARPLAEAIVVQSYRNTALTFGAAVGAVLLISILNMVGLQAARVSKRQHEFSIRAALGASPWPLTRQAIVEAGVLSLAGTALGLGVAWAVQDVVLASAPAMLPRMAEIGIDLRVIAFALVATLAATLVVGIAPVLRAARPDLNDSLKEASRGITDTRYQRWLPCTLRIRRTSCRTRPTIATGWFSCSAGLPYPLRLSRISSGATSPKAPW
jgi:predicted permease